jgi:hypothetical protein
MANLQKVNLPKSHYAKKRKPAFWSFYVQAWTNFSKQDETWTEFSTLEVAACVLCTCAAVKQNGLT